MNIRKTCKNDEYHIYSKPVYIKSPGNHYKDPGFYIFECMVCGSKFYSIDVSGDLEFKTYYDTMDFRTKIFRTLLTFKKENEGD